MNETIETAVPGGRLYGGQTAEQRRLARRERLLDAGLDVFASEGYAAATVRGVIAESGLGERYFYENFADLDELLIAIATRIHDEVLAETLVAVVEAGDDYSAQIRAGVRAFITAMTRDRRKARVKLLEMVGASERVEARRREGMRGIAALIAARGPQPLPGHLDPNLIIFGLVGAINELLLEWLVGAQDISGKIIPWEKITVEQLITNCTALFEGTIRLLEEETQT